MKKKDNTAIPYIERKRVKDSIKLMEIADKKVKDMGDLIDLPFDVFTRYIDEHHFNAGQTKMLKDQIRIAFDNVVFRKESLIKKHKESADAMEKAKIEDALNRVYIVLKRMEDRITYLENREKHLMKDNV